MVTSLSGIFSQAPRSNCLIDTREPTIDRRPRHQSLRCTGRYHNSVAQQRFGRQSLRRCRAFTSRGGQHAVLLGDEVYHYHHKMMLKEPYVGGAWEWHQDYGYWYDYGCLYPDMGSCFIAVDPATRANGCLQVLPSSHRLGRINHMKIAVKQAPTQSVSKPLSKDCRLSMSRCSPVMVSSSTETYCIDPIKTLAPIRAGL